MEISTKKKEEKRKKILALTKHAWLYSDLLQAFIIIIIIDRFYIALFSALEQTHCARMWFYMSEQLFIARF